MNAPLVVMFDPLAMLALAQRRRMTPERFWARVNRDGPVLRPDLGPCWPWTGGCNENGYGRVRWCNEDTFTHRLAFALTNGPFDVTLLVRHACDNPPCCNPAHLLVGASIDNVRDMHERDRAVHKGAPGITNCNAKLTDDLVREYRAAWAGGETLKSITARSGLTAGTIHPMLHRRTWRHVEDAAAGLAVLRATEDGFDRLWAEELGVEVPAAARGAQ